MRGRNERQGAMLLGVTTDEFVPERHPIRRIRPIVDEALAELAPELGRMYSAIGRPSIPPEHLVKASLLMALYSIRSERQFCERLQDDLLFKWFLGLNIIDPAFDHSTLSKNRERFLRDDIALALLGAVTREAQRRKLVSEDHFSVDGTLLQAWASLKSVRPRDEEPPAGGGGGRNPDVDFRGQARRNDTHVSTTDPEARLARKGNGQETRLSFAGHVIMENRSGLILDILVTQADGRAEREASRPGDARPPSRACQAGDAGSRQGVRHLRFCGRAQSPQRSSRISPGIPAAAEARWTTRPLAVRDMP